MKKGGKGHEVPCERYLNAWIGDEFSPDKKRPLFRSVTI
jgi:hypothetical protein